jgi:uncharacterized glyoxalase superfamily protein PhnB
MTTTTKQVFHPTLRYRDPHAAAEWLERAFGFERKALYEGDDGTVQHAEMNFRGGLIMFGGVRDPSEGGYAAIAQPPGTSSVYVVIDDADALHDRVVAAGGDVVAPLSDQDYGSRDFTVRDPEGNLWSFGTYDPWEAG